MKRIARVLLVAVVFVTIKAAGQTAIRPGNLGVFRKLDISEQRLSLELYRFLAAGHPVSATSLAEPFGASVQTVSQILER